MTEDDASQSAGEPAAAASQSSAEPASELTPEPVSEPKIEPETVPASEASTAHSGQNEPFSPPREPLSPTQTSQQSSGREYLAKGRPARTARKQKNIQKILGLFTTKSTITNDDVEKFLHVSDATATRYLNALEKEGKIRQVGKTGRFVVYEKI